MKLYPLADTLPIFEKRENMGASPLAIQTAEHIREDFDKLYNIQIPAGCGILIAAMVDAAIRKSGAPEMLAALEAMLPLQDWTVGQSSRDALAMANAALVISKGGAL